MELSGYIHVYIYTHVVINAWIHNCHKKTQDLARPEQQLPAKTSTDMYIMHAFKPCQKWRKDMATNDPRTCRARMNSSLLKHPLSDMYMHAFKTCQKWSYEICPAHKQQRTNSSSLGPLQPIPGVDQWYTTQLITAIQYTLATQLYCIPVINKVVYQWSTKPAFLCWTARLVTYNTTSRIPPTPILPAYIYILKCTWRHRGVGVRMLLGVVCSYYNTGAHCFFVYITDLQSNANS